MNTQTGNATDGQDLQPVDFHTLHLPSSAKPVDIDVARRFADAFNSLTEAGRQSLTFGDVAWNPENQSDLLVATNFDPTFLDLMDIRPADHPYDGASRIRLESHMVARWLLKAIEERSDGHAKGLQQPLFLLLHASDWAFVPSETAVKVLQSLLVKRRWAFDAIFLYNPGADEGTQATFVYPTSHKQRRGFDPDRVVGHRYDNVNPAFAVT
jgi:hypothetical protein